MNERKVLTNYFDGVPVNSKHIKVMLLIGLGILFDMMDNYNFSFVAPTLMKNWGISLAQVAKINSLFFLGMLFGGLIGGFISDHIGRKKSLLLSALIFSIFSIGNGFAPNVNVFMVMRFLTGFGVASLIIIAVPYLVEMLPAESRGKYQALASGIGYIGIPIIGIVCKTIIPMAPENWRYVYLLGGMGLIIVVLGWFWLEESPRWLVSKGKITEAEKIVEKITGFKADLSHAVQVVEKVSVWYVVREMFNKQHIKKTFMLMTIFMLAYPGGFIFISFAPTLFVTKGFSVEDGLLLSMLMSFGFVAGPFVAAAISDRGGRKIPIVVVLVISLILSLIYASLSSKIEILIFAVLISVAVQALCAMTMTYLGELYPTRIRNAANGIIYSAGRITIALSMLLVPVINKSYGYMGVFLLMALLFLVTAVTVLAWGPRTVGKSLEELNTDQA